jgi:hypothetical protein
MPAIRVGCVTTTKPFRLLWEFRGRIRGKHFAAFAELEEFSQRLLDAGLLPWAPHDAPCPLDEPEATN